MPFLFFFFNYNGSKSPLAYTGHTLPRKIPADKCRPVYTDSILFSLSPDIYALSCMVS
mgnify:CR=1 FL=1